MHHLARFLASVVLLAAAAAMAPAAMAQVCAAPGKDGPAAPLTGVLNAYYPGTADAGAGQRNITVGAVRGPGALQTGDMVLVIQMQDGVSNASFGTTTATYATGFGTAGTYEYGLVESFGGGLITLRNNLVNSYANAQLAGNARKTFQVVRVPQYSAATIPAAGTVTPLAWNGTTGGIVAIDVAGVFNLSGTIDAAGYGFRGGAGRVLAGGAGNTNTSVRFSSANGNGAMKGEGTAGSPRNTFASIGAIYTWAAAGGDFYPNGDNGFGAPGNAGGGGNDGNVGANDQNSGGGGGGNAGAGGHGGNTWNSDLDIGGRGGIAFTAAADRIVMGGGGGAGTSNNGGANHSSFSGASGGGIVMVRAGAISGNGTINASGSNGQTPNAVCCDDGGTGGGGGGSVVLLAANSAGLGAITVNARGGNGSPTPEGSADHGPGGGGGGGAILTTGAVAGASSVAGGTRGAATWNARDGQAGVLQTAQSLTGGNGALPGASCRPQLTVTKLTTTPTRNLPGQTTAQYVIHVANSPTGAAATGVALSDPLPEPFLLSGTSASAGLSLAAGPSAPAAAGTSTVQIGTPGTGTATSYIVLPGGSITLTFAVSLDGAIPGTYQNDANVLFSDPTRSAAATVVSPGGSYETGGAVAGSNYPAASGTGEDITVSGALSSVTSFATLCPASTREVTATNYVTNSDFSDTGASPGHGAGVALAGLNSEPANNAVAYQSGLASNTAGAPDLYQSPFPGNPARNVAGSNFWLLANGNSTGATAADRIWWSQTVSGLVAGHTYTFLVHASSPVSGNQSGGNAQRPNLRLQVTQGAVQNFALGVVLNDSAAADNWRLYQASFLATQTTATLEINNTVVANGGERRGMFALAQPSLRLCAPLANLAIAKTNLTNTVVAGSVTTYQLIVTNGGPNAADGSVVRDFPDDALECNQVLCTSAQGGAACPAAGGGAGQLSIGNLVPPGSGVVLPALPANSTVTLSLQCMVEEAAPP